MHTKLFVCAAKYLGRILKTAAQSVDDEANGLKQEKKANGMAKTISMFNL